MNIKIESIGPALAKKYLDLNIDNRNVRDQKVREYANEMKQGRWHLTGDPIRFFDDGSMADGQHRCLAIIHSGVTVKIAVVRGIERDAMAGIDMGSKRTVADYMHLHGGLADASIACSAVRAIFNQAFGFQSYVISPSMTQRCLEIYGNDLNFVMSAMRGFTPGRRAAVHAALTVGMHARPELDSFVHVLGTGEEAKKGHPALALRNWLIGPGAMHQTKARKAAYTQSLFNAMNAYVNKSTMTRIPTGPNGINAFMARERHFIDLFSEEVKNLRYGNA